MQDLKRLENTWFHSVVETAIFLGLSAEDVFLLRRRVPFKPGMRAEEELLTLAKAAGIGVDVLQGAKDDGASWIRRGMFDVRRSHGFGAVCFQNTGLGVVFVGDYALSNPDVTLREALENYNLPESYSDALLNVIRTEMLSRVGSLKLRQAYADIVPLISVEVGKTIDPESGALVLRHFLRNGFGEAPPILCIKGRVLTEVEALSVVRLARSAESPYWFLPSGIGVFLPEKHPRAVRSTNLFNPGNIRSKVKALRYTSQERECLYTAFTIFRPISDHVGAKYPRKLEDIR